MISTPKNSTGAAENCANPEQDQSVTEGCGTLGPIEAPKVFSTPPAPSLKVRRNGMFIYDDEIRERYGDKAEQIIAALDTDPRTQKDKATRPKEARYRPAVEEWLQQFRRTSRPPTSRSEHSANMGEFGATDAG